MTRPNWKVRKKCGDWEPPGLPVPSSGPNSLPSGSVDFLRRIKENEIIA